MTSFFIQLTSGPQAGKFLTVRGGGIGYVDDALLSVVFTKENTGPKRRDNFHVSLLRTVREVEGKTRLRQIPAFRDKAGFYTANQLNNN